MAALTFSGTAIALVVRGKKSARHHPNPMEQHADCILADGAPIGFYGREKDESGAWNAPNPTATALGMGLPGVVYDFDGLKKYRPWYVDLAAAKKKNCCSTILMLHVTTDQAKRFKDAWDEMRNAPGPFNFVGYNCSTHASLAFVRAGIFSDDIPELDTPDRLYDQLAKAMVGRRRSYSGFVGFTTNSGGGYLVVVEPQGRRSDDLPELL